MTILIASGTAAATSAEFTLAADEAVSISAFAPSSAPIPARAWSVIEKKNGSTWANVGTLSGVDNEHTLSAAGTYRVRKVALDEPYGIESQVAIPDGSGGSIDESRLLPDGGNIGDAPLRGAGGSVNWTALSMGGGGASLAPAHLTVERVLRAAEVAMGSNQYTKSLPALANPPTVTSGTSAPSGFTRSYPPMVSGVMPWNYYGGVPILDGWGIRLAAHFTNCHSAMIETLLDGDAVTFILERGIDHYRFMVKEGNTWKHVDPDNIGIAPVAGTGSAYYTLTFGTRAHRLIAVEQYSSGNTTLPAGRFGGALVKDGDQLLRPTRSTPRWISVGDSMIAGYWNIAADNRVRIMNSHLGVRDTWMAVAIGSGSPTWEARKSNWLDNAPGIITFCLSWMDWVDVEENGGSWPTFVNLVMGHVEEARAALPNCIIFVEGLTESKEKDYTGQADWQEFNTLVAAEIAALGDNYIRFIDTVSGYESPITGYFGGGGNYDEYLSNPDEHYNTLSDMHLGMWTAQQYLEAFEDMYRNMPAPEVEPPVPALNSIAGSDTFIEDAATRTTLLATVNVGTLTSVASTTPSLPSGISASVSGANLSVTGSTANPSSATAYTIVVNHSDGGTLTYTLTLTVNSVTAPAFSPTSASRTLTEDEAYSNDMATLTGGTLASIASVTPSLPAGLTASVVSGALRLSGTPTAIQSSTAHTIVGNVTGGSSSTANFTLTLVVEAAEASVPWTPLDLADTSKLAWYSSDDVRNTFVSGELDVMFDKSGNGRHVAADNAASRGVMDDTLDSKAVVSNQWDTLGRNASFRLNGSNLTANASEIRILSLQRQRGGHGPSDWPASIHVSTATSPDEGRMGIYYSGGGGSNLEMWARRVDGGAEGSVGVDSFTVDAWQIIDATVDYTTGEGNLRIGGEVKKSGTITDWGGYGNVNNTNGAIVLNDRGLKATSAEYVIYAGPPISDAEWEKVVGAVAWRWAQQAGLVSGHPYKTAAPMT